LNNNLEKAMPQTLPFGRYFCVLIFSYFFNVEKRFSTFDACVEALQVMKNEAKLDHRVCCCCIIFTFGFSCAARSIYADWGLGSMERPASSRDVCFSFFLQLVLEYL
jgi:hypothetical protein